MQKQIGLIGLGKMGGGLTLNLKDKGWDVIAFNRTSTVTDDYAQQGINGIYDVNEFVIKLKKPRTVWLMLTAGDPTQNAIFGENGLVKILEEGDTIIEGGNSQYKKDSENAKELKKFGINYIDVGVSGGPGGARNGACLMIGGEKKTFDYLEPLFMDLAIKDGYKFFEGYGAGHFVKMVHNGIEYGMMQAIAEGFNVLKKSDYNLDLMDVVDIYNHGSVIESRLTQWLADGYKKYGVELEEISGSVAASGEGQWTVDAAKEMKEPIPIIEGSLDFRYQSQKNPSYIGKVLSVLRNMFGYHDVSKLKS